MRAMILSRAGAALQSSENFDPGEPQPGEVVVEVDACGVCRTDLHIADGELDRPKLPLVLGHEIVGTVRRVGSNVTTLQRGDRVGIPWLGWTCGRMRASAFAFPMVSPMSPRLPSSVPDSSVTAR